MANTPFPLDPVLTAISVAYRNTSYVADDVLPRSPVEREEFGYLEYDVEESFRVPDARVGRRGRVNEVLLTASRKTAETGDYGLDDPIPWPDIDQARTEPGLPDQVGFAVMVLTDYLAIGREQRAAALVFDAAQYPTGFKVELTGNNRWDVHAEADSDPITDILAGMNAALMKPTHLLLSSDTWTAVRTHPRIVAAVHGNDGTTGITTRQQVASLFELQQVLVAGARLNTAKYGQDATLERVWGPHALLFHKSMSATLGRGVTFALTGEYGARVVGTRDDPDIGLRGGTRVRVGESVKELIVASRAAFFFENAVGDA